MSCNIFEDLGFLLRNLGVSVGYTYIYLKRFQSKLKGHVEGVIFSFLSLTLGSNTQLKLTILFP